MRRKGNGSQIAKSIVRDYKIEQFMKRKVKRQKCKDKDCIECKWNEICEDKEKRVEVDG